MQDQNAGEFQSEDIQDSGSLKSPKSQKKIRKTDQPGSPLKQSGHWTKEEHNKYLKFLEDHAHLKKNNKIFKPMSDVIGTRSPSQCRSHHQKFNPMSPQVIKRNQNRMRKMTQTPSTQNQEYYMEEEFSINKDEIKLKLFNEESQQHFQEPTDLDKFLALSFSLDDYV